MKIGDKIRLKKLDYSEGSPYRYKVNRGVCYVSYMEKWNVLFKIIEVGNENRYKIINPNYPDFWVEEWQITSAKKIKLEI